MRTVLTSVLILGLAATLSADDKPAERKPLDPTLVKLSNFVGGMWTNDDPKFRVEFKYDWHFKKSAIRSVGHVDKGGPKETPVEATLGYDPARKSVYYLDLHGSESVYKGTVRADGDALTFEFESIVGAPGKWRSVGKFTDSDTYDFTIFGEKAGEWQPIVKQTLKRKKA